MSYGANIYNDAGQLTYSTDYPVYQFLGTFVLANTGFSYETVRIQSTVTPLVFVKPYFNGSTTETVCHQLQYLGSDQWDIRASTSAGYTITKVNNYTGGYPNQFYTSNGLNVEVLIFVRPRNTDAATGYGMNVYDSSGNLSFTSTMKPLKISAFHDTTEQAGSTYQNADPYWIPETLTGGSIPTNWAACVGEVGYARKATTAPAYYNFNGNQGVIYEIMGAGRGSNSTTVNFDESKWESFVPPGVGGQYPSYKKWGGRRILFIDHTPYSTPYYNVSSYPSGTVF